MLILVVLSGCGGAETSPDAVVIDLLALAPPAPPPAEDLPQARARTWHFAEGLPPGWSAGPEGVIVRKTGDGVLLEHPRGQLPWLEFHEPAGIDPLLYGALALTLQARGSEACATYYSFSWPARYERHLRSRARLTPSDTPSRHRFDLPAADGFETPIHSLRFYPSLDTGGARVDRAALMPRKPAWLAHKVLGRNRVGLKQDFRRCWRLAGTGERRVRVALPDGSPRLSFAVGRLLGHGPAAVRVALEAPLGGPVHDLVRVDTGSSTGDWLQQTVDLQAWAGREVVLCFAAETGEPGAVTLVANPAVHPAPPAGADRPPNVLLILVDTLRADRLSGYGAMPRTSPHLDRLARRGTLFTGALAPSSWTIPSVAALLTGHYPGRLQVGAGKGSQLPDREVTLAEQFSRAGYDTGAFSANFIISPRQGYARGFDAFYLAPYKEYAMPAAALNDRAGRWLAERGERPFFCYLQYMDPHSPYAPPESGRRPASNADTFHPRRVGGYREGDIYPLVMGHETLADPADAVGVVRAYDDEVRYVDRQIGLLLARLRRQGLLEQTVVAVVADHGEELHDRGFWSHGYTLYQELLHVPLILNLPVGLRPSLAPGRRIATPASLVDLGPTLLALAGRDAGETDGRDLLSAPDDRGLVSETSGGGVPPRLCLRRGPYKYVRFYRERAGDEAPTTQPGIWLWANGPAAEELYHLGEDPGERRNLAAERPRVAARMRQEVERLAELMARDAVRDGPAGGKMDDDTEERLRALGYIEE